MSVLLFALAASGAVRAASADLCADEYLLLLARPGEVVSVSKLSHDPADSPLWRSAKGAASNGGSIEDLIAVRPTLLVSMGGAAKGSRKVASGLGFRSLALPYPTSIDDVAANLRHTAVAIGDPHRADPWVARLEALRRSVPPTRDTIFVSGQGESVSPDGLSAQWMRLAGLKQRALPGGRVTLEQLRMRPPAVLLLSDYRASQPSLGQRWLRHPWVVRAPSRHLRADGRRWTCGGPLMIEEIERLRRER